MKTGYHLGLCVLAMLLEGCDFIPGGDKERGGASDRSKPRSGPVENIDEEERRQAAVLTPSLGPVQKEIKLFRADVRSKFEEEDFEALEVMAATFVKEEALFGNGSWKISQFYSGIKQRFGDSDDQYLHDLRRLQKWRSKRPESAFAKIAYGDFLTEYAWHARGSGYAETVTERGWQLFGERLAEAGELLLPMMDEGVTDPYWGSVLLKVALGQGWTDEDYGQLMGFLKELSPQYYNYDVKRAYSLLPRWHGEKGDWEKYAAWAADQPEGLGDEVYARIVISLVGFYGDVFRETNASWSRTRKGLRILLEKYPESLSIVSSAARLAAGKDREMSQELFNKLGDTYIEDCWINPEQFVHLRTWARTGKW